MKTISIRQAGKRHIPVLDVMGARYQFWHLRAALTRWRRARRMQFRWQDGLVQLTVCNRKVSVLPKYAMMIEDEREEWDEYYLHGFEEGMSVMDVGAGCGETAIFYLAHGARKVVAIESDQGAFKLLRKNTEGLAVECIGGPFRLEYLNFDVDFCKMDCEGCETLFLGVEAIDTRLVVEVHKRMIGQEASTSLIRKFNLRLLKDYGGYQLYSN